MVSQLSDYYNYRRLKWPKAVAFSLEVSKNKSAKSRQRCGLNKTNEVKCLSSSMITVCNNASRVNHSTVLLSVT